MTPEFFEQLLADPSFSKEIAHQANFWIDWKKLQILNKDIILKLALPKSQKRENVFDSNNFWVDTRPIHVIDLGVEDSNLILRYEEEIEIERTNRESPSQPPTVEPILYNTNAEAKKLNGFSEKKGKPKARRMRSHRKRKKS